MMPSIAPSFLLALAQSATTSGTDRHPLAGSIAGLMWLLPVLPLLGAVINGSVAITSRSRGLRGGVAEPTTAGNLLVSIVGPGVVIAAFALALAMFMAMIGAGDLPTPFIARFASWMMVGTLVIDWAFQLDQLSMLMVLVITGVGSLIHVFSIGYMRADPGYARYFAYLNLFVAFMLVLVLGSSYPVLFVGWEGVGLASYLLIGFWFDGKANANAGKKAFIVNRVGDFGFLVAMFLIWVTTERLDFVGAHATLGGMAGTSVVLAIALFLFVGCVGKSAQLPLYIWLPDAMAGPTPVSALIHAATMVTAGVYLVARAAPIFSGAPEASLLVTAIGALTAIFAASIALRQWDIKKVLAYSTVSQLGYMFVAVGSGAYAAGVFHLVTHAFFKALLFLGAGSVIHALQHAYHHTHRDADPQDMRNMGGLARFMPATAVAMTIATLAIAGVPPLAGFFSKDEILAGVFTRAQGSPLANASLLGIPGSTLLYGAYGLGVITAVLTAIYMTRLLLLTFFGANRTGDTETSALHEAPAIMTAPVLALGMLTLVGGWLNLPALLPLGPVGVLEDWLAPVTAPSALRLTGTGHLDHATELMLVAIAVGVALAGILFAWFRYRAQVTNKVDSPVDTSVLARAFHIDRFVDAFVVRPMNAFASVLLARGVDVGVERFFSASGRLLSRSAEFVGTRIQDGDVGKYAWLLAAGALALLAALTLS